MPVMDMVKPLLFIADRFFSRFLSNCFLAFKNSK
jgi:hypothetical protein